MAPTRCILVVKFCKFTQYPDPAITLHYDGKGLCKFRSNTDGVHCVYPDWLMFSVCADKRRYVAKHTELIF